MTGSHQIQVPPTAALYFRRLGVDLLNQHPVIHQEYVPDQGWRGYSFRKRASASWLRKRRADCGVTHVQLSCGGHNADFSVTELLSAQATTEQAWAPLPGENETEA